jgi:hypothetical protein
MIRLNLRLVIKTNLVKASMFCGVQGLMLHISLKKHNVYCTGTLVKAQISTLQDRNNNINIIVRKHYGYPVSFDRRINIIQYMQVL